MAPNRRTPDTKGVEVTGGEEAHSLQYRAWIGSGGVVLKAFTVQDLKPLRWLSVADPRIAIVLQESQSKTQLPWEFSMQGLPISHLRAARTTQTTRRRHLEIVQGTSALCRHIFKDSKE